MNKPDASDEFANFLQDVKPLSPTDTVERTHADQSSLSKQLRRQALEQVLAEDENYLSEERVDPIDPYDFLSYKKDGVQEAVFKNLRLGKYQIESTINLKLMPAREARKAIFTGIQDAHRLGLRCLLVQHGLGLKSKPFPALIKSYTKLWLMEIDEVLAFHTAAKHHGGLAAAYVLLKKNSEQRLHNKERHQKRR